MLGLKPSPLLDQPIRDSLALDGVVATFRNLPLIRGAERPEYIKAMQLRSAFRNLASQDPELLEIEHKLESISEKHNVRLIVALDGKYQSENSGFIYNWRISDCGLDYGRVAQSTEHPAIRAFVPEKIDIKLAMSWVKKGITADTFRQDLETAKSEVLQKINEIEDEEKAS